MLFVGATPVLLSEVVLAQVASRMPVGPVGDFLLRVVHTGQAAVPSVERVAVERDRPRFLELVHDDAQVEQVSALPSELLAKLVHRERLALADVVCVDGVHHEYGESTRPERSIPLTLPTCGVRMLGAFVALASHEKLL